MQRLRNEQRGWVETQNKELDSEVGWSDKRRSKRHYCTVFNMHDLSIQSVSLQNLKVKSDKLRQQIYFSRLGIQIRHYFGYIDGTIALSACYRGHLITFYNVYANNPTHLDIFDGGDFAMISIRESDPDPLYVNQPVWAGCRIWHMALQKNKSDFLHRKEDTRGRKCSIQKSYCACSRQAACIAATGDEIFRGF